MGTRSKSNQQYKDHPMNDESDDNESRSRRIYARAVENARAARTATETLFSTDSDGDDEFDAESAAAESAELAAAVQEAAAIEEAAATTSTGRVNASLAARLARVDASLVARSARVEASLANRITKLEAILAIRNAAAVDDSCSAAKADCWKARTYAKALANAKAAEAEANEESDEDEQKAARAAYHCDICKAPFGAADALGDHRREHFLVWECPSCNDEFFGATQINYHRQHGHGRKRRQGDFFKKPCKLCAPQDPLPRFAGTRQLMAHVRDVHPLRYEQLKCRWPGCEQVFETRTLRGNHTYVQHPGQTEWAACDVCGMVVTVCRIVAHRLLHFRETPIFQCDICKMTAHKKSQIACHIRRIHVGEKRYQCDYCGAKFHATGALNVHHRVHTGERPHKCEHCGKTFGHYSDWKRHLRSHGGETKRFLCTQCGESFWENKHLVQHRKNGCPQQQDGASDDDDGSRGAMRRERRMTSEVADEDDGVDDTAATETEKWSADRVRFVNVLDESELN